MSSLMLHLIMSDQDFDKNTGELLPERIFNIDFPILDIENYSSEQELIARATLCFEESFKKMLNNIKSLPPLEGDTIKLNPNNVRQSLAVDCFEKTKKAIKLIGDVESNIDSILTGKSEKSE